MTKPIIGIIAPRYTLENRPFNNSTNFVNNFPKRIIEAGGIPIGMLFPDGNFEESEMKLCDGFLFQGGPTIESAQISAIHYAIKNKKPILGICLGMQTMAGYEWLYKQYGDNITYDLIKNVFKIEDEEAFLEKKSGHDELNPFYLDKINKSKQEVIIDKESRLAKIFGTNINMPSIHGYIVKEGIFKDSPYFKVVGKSKDGVIEAIESTDSKHFMIGVQFHPELEKQNLKLFKELIKEAKK